MWDRTVMCHQHLASQAGHVAQQVLRALQRIASHRAPRHFGHYYALLRARGHGPLTAIAPHSTPCTAAIFLLLRIILRQMSWAFVTIAPYLASSVVGVASIASHYHSQYVEGEKSHMWNTWVKIVRFIVTAWQKFYQLLYNFHLRLTLTIVLRLQFLFILLLFTCQQYLILFL